MDLHQIIFEGRLDGRRMGAGVYAVEHVATGKRLICATTCLSKRLWDQQRYLEGRKHHNRHLQADLERDGPQGFRFVLLTLVNNRSELRYLKRLYVQQSRERGKTYHPDEPKSRKLLVSERPTQQPAVPEANPGTDLKIAMARLRQFVERGEVHTELTRAWKEQSIEKMLRDAAGLGPRPPDPPQAP